jgi:hypothetical protein
MSLNGIELSRKQVEMLEGTEGRQRGALIRTFAELQE